MLDRLRDILVSVPRLKIVPKPIRERILDMMAEEEAETGFVDYITLSTSLLFSMKYATTLEEMRKHTMYNRIRRSGYDANGYLDGIVVESCITANCSRSIVTGMMWCSLSILRISARMSALYNMYWKLSDYLDVLKVLVGHRYVYFNLQQVIDH